MGTPETLTSTLKYLPKDVVNKIDRIKRSKEFYEQRVLPFEKISEFAMKVRKTPKLCVNKRLRALIADYDYSITKNSFALWVQAIKSTDVKGISHLGSIYDSTARTMELLSIKHQWGLVCSSIERNHNRTWEDIKHCHFYDVSIDVPQWTINDSLYDPVKKVPIMYCICGYDPRNKCQLQYTDPTSNDNNTERNRREDIVHETPHQFPRALYNAI